MTVRVTAWPEGSKYVMRVTWISPKTGSAAAGAAVIAGPAGRAAALATKRARREATRKFMTVWGGRRMVEMVESKPFYMFGLVQREKYVSYP